MQMAYNFESVYLPTSVLSYKEKKNRWLVNEVITLMTRRKDRVLRGANKGNYKWVQIKHQLNTASQALVDVRNMKSLTVAFLGKMPAYTIHWFSNQVPKDQGNNAFVEKQQFARTQKEAKLFILKDPCHLACATTHMPKIPAATQNHLSTSECFLLNLGKKKSFGLTGKYFWVLFLKALTVFHSLLRGFNLLVPRMLQ